METETLIIGAGPAGLACAGALKMHGITAQILEKGESVGTVWRHHYDRLHLHTAKQYSGLPGHPMPKDYPRYPSKNQVIDYLEDYARHFGISPDFNTEVTKIRSKDRWEIETSRQTYTAKNVIFAGGVASHPHIGKFTGIESFEGQVIHSNDYQNAEPFRGKHVLVIGFGNSGGEIALDLAEAGIETTMSVRSPVNVIPRDVLGIPAQSFSIAERHLPPRLVDLLNGGITRLRTGDITKLGLKKSTKGPVTQIVEDKRIPLIDIGTLKAIKDGLVSVRGKIERVDGNEVRFEDAKKDRFDAIILATGFKPNLREILPDLNEALDAHGAPKKSGSESGPKGFAFCGYRVSPTGYLREIRLEAEAIAKEMA